MHEVLLLGGGALASTFGLWAARLRWLRNRRNVIVPIGDKVDMPPMPTTEGHTLQRRGLGAEGTVLVFMSNRCPGVKAYDGRLKRLHAAYDPRGIRFVGVNSTDERFYPDEGLDGMRAAMAERGLPLVYVKDADQRLARRVGAVCTPQAFVLDSHHQLVYRGRIDDALLESRARVPHLANALDALLEGRPVPIAETAPLGCSLEYSRPSKRGAVRRLWHRLLPRQAVRS